MNLRQLRHLIAIAETGSFTRASQFLNLTQSALSRSIRQLEDELQVQLVDRTGYRNELTRAGQAVTLHARQITADIDDIRHTVALLRSGSVAPLRLGLSSGPAVILMKPFLLRVAQDHPDLQVTLMLGPIDAQLQQLRRRELDAMVVMRSIAPAADLQIEDMAELRAGFVCRAGHPLVTAGGQVEPVQLLEYPMASTPRLSSETIHALMGLFGAKVDLDRTVNVRCDEISSLLEMVELSDAIYLGILAAARRQLEAGVLAALTVKPAFSVRVPFVLVTPQGRSSEPSVSILRSFIADEFHDAEALGLV